MGNSEGNERILKKDRARAKDYLRKDADRAKSARHT